ncbi:hypothetical protein [Parafilimonas sp.]|uniref:hypothetical protein n=1 Tax=Parafilimonas sp. TaxID=1969739 RepID=UPI0039E31886
MSRNREYDFVITLRHPNYKVYNVITVLMCVLAIAAEVFALLHTPFFSYNWINIVLMAVIVINFMLSVFNQSENVITFKWALYAAAFLWLMYPLHLPWIAVLFIVAALLERQIKFPQEIGFSKEAITFNTFPFKNYSWQQVKNAMLKDNMLTLDFNNNRIIQKETESNVPAEMEREFNEFCKQQIARSL